MSAPEVNLAGKDYFTQEEAAHYACVSESQFRAKSAEYGLLGFWWMGKKVYRKVDVQQAMEAEWQKSPQGAVTIHSYGPTRKRTNAGGSRSAKSEPSQNASSTTSSESKTTNSPPGQGSSTRTVVPLRPSESS
jgi:hypothetical protein